MTPKSTKESKVVQDLECARLAYERGHRKSLDDAVAKGVEKADVLENNDDEWLSFTQAKRWAKRKAKPKNSRDALFFTLVYLLSNRQQASKVHRAIRPFYSGTTFNGMEVVARVRAAGGYERCARKAAARKVAQAPAKALLELPDPDNWTVSAVFPYDIVVRVVDRRGKRLIGQDWHTR